VKKTANPVAALRANLQKARVLLALAQAKGDAPLARRRGRAVRLLFLRFQAIAGAEAAGAIQVPKGRIDRATQ
jgi:hypothetical protein